MAAARKPLAFNFTEGVPQEISPTVDTVAFAMLQLNGIGGVGIDTQGQSIINLPAPVNNQDAVPKSYVDSISQGLSIKPSVRAMSTTNIASLSGPVTIDGISLTSPARVLLAGQTTGSQNGIWVVQSGAWTRPPDFQTGAGASGSFTFVEGGTNYGSEGWVNTNQPGTDIIDTSNLTYTQFTGLGEVTPGNGLAKSGNAIAVTLAPNSGLQFTNGAIDHLLVSGGGLGKGTNGLQVVLNPNATLAEDANGVRVLGLPSGFTVNGNVTASAVTASALNTLTAGTASQADSLHTHMSVLGAVTCADTYTSPVALSPGDCVAWGSTADTLVRADAASLTSSRVIGIAAASVAANGPALIIKRGVAKNVLAAATPGTAYYLNSGGGLTTTFPTGASVRVFRIGWAKNATDLDVQPQDFGLRSA